MCGRFTQAQIAELDREIFKLLDVPALEPNYNVAPTENAAVVRERAQGRRTLDLLRWGLVPSWGDDLAMGARLINARAETVDTKPAFRDAFAARRCLVPADGFYEWRRGPAGKQPYYIRARDGHLAFAALWERCELPVHGPIESFTIVTTDANELVCPIHDRMPVILPPEAFDEWLDPANRRTERLKRLLVACPADKLEMHPVSRYVNSPHHKGPECIAPVAE